MNLVLDTLTSRKSFRLLGHGLGLLASTVLLRLNDSQAKVWQAALVAAGILAAFEAVASLLDLRARRLRKLAPGAFPFKNLGEDDREFLQSSLLLLPGRSAGRAMLAWACVFAVMAFFTDGPDMAVAALALGAPVSALTHYFGNTVMGRRVAPFYYFEGDAPDALSAYLPSLAARLRLWVLAPILVLAPFPVMLSFFGLRTQMSVWFWLLAWALAALAAASRVFQDLVVSPVEDLGSALSQFGEGDFSALLDVTSGDALGVTTNRYNKAVRKIDRRFFIKENFVAMVPYDKSEGLFDGRLKLDGEEREVAVIACTVKGEGLTLAAFNKFCAAVADVVDKQGGCIDEISHGRVTALFNAPLTLENFEAVARLATQELGERLAVFKAQQRMQAGLSLEVSVGISVGMATLGLAGPKGRQRYTVLGAPAAQARAQSAL